MAKKNVTLTVDEEVWDNFGIAAERVHLSRSALFTVLAQFAFESPSVGVALGWMSKAVSFAPDSASRVAADDLAVAALVNG